MPRTPSTASLSHLLPICRQPTLERLEPRCLLAAIAMSDDEQLLLELMNRARADPAAEAVRLGVGLDDGLNPGTISAAPKPPLAPNQLLINAAGAHSQDMIDRDFFDHVNPSGKTPGDRIAAAGYPARAWAENIALHRCASDAHDVLFGSAGHRLNLLSTAYREIGVGVRARDSWGVNVTEVFATRLGNPFLTGVAFSDQVVADEFFTSGEGLDGVTITATSRTTGTTYSTTTGPSGGYALQVPSGTYDLTAAGGELASPRQLGGVTVGTVNVKVDFVEPYADLGPPVARDDRALAEKDTAVVIDVLQNDSGRLASDPVGIEIVTPPGAGQVRVDAFTGRITYSPQLGHTGPDEFRYRLQGAGGELSPAARVRVTVVDLAGHPWRNPNLPADVNADHEVGAYDALLLINHLNTHQPRVLPAPCVQAEFPPSYWDVTGDGVEDARDVLAVINWMNRHADGEGEASDGGGGPVVPLPATAAAVLDAAETTPSPTAAMSGLDSASDSPGWLAAVPTAQQTISAVSKPSRPAAVEDESRAAIDDLLGADLAPLLDVIIGW